MPPRVTQARSTGIIIAALFALTTLSGCGALDHGFLNAQGPVATHERQLYITVSIVLLFVAGPVLLLVPLFGWHYRLSNKKDAYRPKWAFSWPIEGLIWIPPIGIVVGLAFLLWHWTQIDDPYRRLPGGPAIEVEAIALDWKWVFLYPREGIATVNQLAIPVGHPMHIRLTSGTVMQSLLIPQLAGQINTMAGMTTELNIAASRRGTYLGENTQYNGTGFHQEKFSILALDNAGYAQWIARVHASGRPLDAATWARLSRKSVIPQPVFFSTTMPHLFERVVAANGGAAHSMAMATNR